MNATASRGRIDDGDIADISDVMVVMAEAFDPAYGEAWTDAQCAGIMGMPGTWLVVARDDGVPTGFALARTFAGEGELLLLAVRPAYRQSGIGQSLLKRIIHESRRLGVARLHLEVRAGNEAIHLYRRAGFEQVGVRKGYYRGKDDKGFDALTFSRDLTVSS